MIDLSFGRHSWSSIAARIRVRSGNVASGAEADGVSLLPIALTTVLVGIGGGLGGMGLVMLLHFVQHLAYGYSLNYIIGPESFLQGVSAASPLRRFYAVLGCGVLAGFGWAALQRFGNPLASVSKAVKSRDHRMPAVSTIVHSILQIVTVALGSPLGREVAPREVGALFAGFVSRHARLSAKETQIMVACGAGAGLAAVYDVPIAASIFVLEVLLRSARPSIIVPAAVSCTIAATVATIGLGTEVQYTMPTQGVNLSLIAASILFGPLFGAAGHGYKKLMQHAQQWRPRGAVLILSAPTAFALIGWLSLYFPELLGNGKGPAQLAFSDNVDLGRASVLLVLKVFVVALALRGGARGGLLTPGIAAGSLLAIVIGSVWNFALPALPLGAFAIIGASAFLGSSMTMPITAVALLIEFMHLPSSYLLPLLVAAAGATLGRITLQRRFPVTDQNIATAA